MPRASFDDAARRCHLTATTYTYRHGFVLDEPLIDFTREAEPEKAMRCFDFALGKIDREASERGVTNTSYIWEYRL